MDNTLPEKAQDREMGVWGVGEVVYYYIVYRFLFLFALFTFLVRLFSSMFIYIFLYNNKAQYITSWLWSTYNVPYNQPYSHTARALGKSLMPLEWWSKEVSIHFHTSSNPSLQAMAYQAAIPDSGPKYAQL